MLHPIRTSGGWDGQLCTADSPWWAEFHLEVTVEEALVFGLGFAEAVWACHRGGPPCYEADRVNGRTWLAVHTGENRDGTVQLYLPRDFFERFRPTDPPPERKALGVSWEAPRYYRDRGANGGADHYVYRVFLNGHVERLFYDAHRGSLFTGRYYLDGFDVSSPEPIPSLPPDVVEGDFLTAQAFGACAGCLEE